ncbi:hypothetical protein BAUCODRAFT_243573 [Baudoinia panamericana UAMH 10762]|uniref:DNA2/NAM7 helicase-like C-terminal domain-containing protein n=1 Tax=Baudoinia panamericana (strain UAMH 10762) TaxID=717646 RepID=M2MAJ2_BAUPA|nr:uncharacterized protein BAUCODRAFT_243573 [Baudoinia panamericana UAMH 10762]EMC93486.1 hypothetical protein BAUCODRAFT_243573 [Baudoinia panamericana UAMH 10762]
MSYQACKRYIAAVTQYFVTTTGNVCATELDAFTKGAEFGVPCHKVVIFVDEAAKDLEINVWAGIVNQTWADKVHGVFLFGDDKQLKPTNTSSKKNDRYNAFSDRLDISLPCRLVRQGFPHFRLLEQRRMNAAIAAFPNRAFYDGLLRDGPKALRPLEPVMLGLHAVLKGILQKKLCNNIITNEHVRLAWIEIVARREYRNDSAYVDKHTSEFFEKVYPDLLGYFKQPQQEGKTVEGHMMIICAYKEALLRYCTKRDELLKRDASLTLADMPRILTVEASQGEESTMVVLDGSFQFGDAIGFMDDKGRCNVALTRAKEVLWVLGGRMGMKVKGEHRSYSARTLLEMFERGERDPHGNVLNGITRYKVLPG